LFRQIKSDKLGGFSSGRYHERRIIIVFTAAAERILYRLIHLVPFFGLRVHLFQACWSIKLYPGLVRKDLNYYLNQPWTFTYVYDNEYGWYVSVKELTGCTSQGATFKEAKFYIHDALRLYILCAIEDDLDIPIPA
jgi:predicted RNase H-like HicB family nuclease